jgi:hypothetical protein
VSLIQKKVTPAVLDANRENSRKSTGPRTLAGKRRVGRNAGKYYVFGQVTPERMRELGEDPAEFEKLRQSLRRAIKPRDGFEEILVDEMAVNRWRLARLRRAETGMLVNRRESVELKLRNPSIGEDSPEDGLVIKYRGLAGTNQSPEKYMQIGHLLMSLYSMVKKEGFTPEGMKILTTVYGEYPSVAGTGLISQFKRELEASTKKDTTDPEGEAVPQDKAGDEAGMTGRAYFLKMLLHEATKNQSWLQAQAALKTIPLPASVSDALLTLPEDDSQRIMKYEAMLQREFERGQKQLLDWRNRRGQARTV